MGNADTVRSAYDAFAEGNIQGIVDVQDEGVRWHIPESLPYGGSYEGHDGIQEFFGKFFESWEEFEIQTDDFIESGDHVAVTAQARGKSKSGNEGGGPIAHVWKLSDGKVVHLQAYTDTARELETVKG